MYAKEYAINSNPMLNTGANGAAQTEVRPHERAIRECHARLETLEATINSAELRLAPVLLPVPPEPEGNDFSEIRACSSDVVTTTTNVSDRITVLTLMLGKLLDRVQV